MKKTKFLAPLALTAAMAAGGFIGGNTYAIDMPRSVRILHNDSSFCWLYSSDSSSSNTPCETSVGSFDATNSIVTLNNPGSDATQLWIEGYGLTLNPVTIKANINLGISVESDADLIFDLGEYKLETADGILGGRVSVKQGDKLITINSGTLATKISADNLAISGGTFINKETVGTHLKNLRIDGGAYSDSEPLWIDESAVVTDGKLKTTGYISLEDGATFEMTGGEVDLGNELYALSGLGKDNNVVTISGGAFNVKNAANGITLEGSSVINFNGGVSTFENVTTYAVQINDSTDPEHAIKFGTDMGIKEPHTYVYWTDDTFGALKSNLTGIAPKNKNSTVTIAKGYTVNKFKGWDIGKIDYDDEDTPVKVPDTGANSNEEGGNALAIFAVSTFVVLGVFALAIALKIHAAGHFKFDK